MTSTLPTNPFFPGQDTGGGTCPREPPHSRAPPKLRVSFFANDNIADHLLDGELDQLEVEVAGKVREMLRSLVIDIDNDHKHGRNG